MLQGRLNIRSKLKLDFDLACSRERASLKVTVHKGSLERKGGEGGVKGQRSGSNMIFLQGFSHCCLASLAARLYSRHPHYRGSERK